MSKEKSRPLRLLVEGWTKYAHSYAHVNLNQLLALAKYESAHPDELELYCRESPPYFDKWPVYESAFPVTLTREEDVLVKSIKRYSNEVVDVIYRINFPHNLRLAADPLTTKVVMFFTAEFGKLTAENFEHLDPELTGGDTLVNVERLRALLDTGLFYACVPAQWNLRAFIEKEEDRAGSLNNVLHRYVDTKSVAVIPHGADVSKLYADVDGRKSLRAKLKLGPTDFAFLHIGAMTANKNVLSILNAFYDIACKNDNIHLILKGNSSMYDCWRQIMSYLAFLIENNRIDKTKWQDEIGARVHMIDGNVDFDSLRWLYSACDCYIAPYMGEGFNLPVLEAMACGLPLIVTKGGATDDFVHPDCALFVQSDFSDAPPPGGKWLNSTLADIEHQMERIMTPGEDGGIHETAQRVGPEHVQRHFTWDVIIEKHLLPFLRHVNDTSPIH